jgi:hypothetical protein
VGDVTVLRVFLGGVALGAGGALMWFLAIWLVAWKRRLTF